MKKGVKSLKLKPKLLIALFVVMIVSSISGLTAISTISDIGTRYQYALANYGFAQGDIGKLMACLGSVNVSVHDTIGYMDETALAAAQETYTAQVKKMEDYFRNVGATILAEDVMASFRTAEDAWKRYQPLAEELMEAGDTEDAAVIAEVQFRLYNELDPEYNTIYSSLTDMLAAKVADGNELSENLDSRVRNSMLAVALFAALSAIISALLGIAYFQWRQQAHHGLCKAAEPADQWESENARSRK